MMHARALLAPLLAFALVVASPGLAQITAKGESEAVPITSDVVGDRGAPSISDVQAFRVDVLQMIDELEKALDRAARNQVVGPDVTRILAASGMALPFPEFVRETIENATLDELTQARKLFGADRTMFEVPAVFHEALAELESIESFARAGDLCETNYAAFDAFKSKRTSIKGLTIANDIVTLVLQAT